VNVHNRRRGESTVKGCKRMNQKEWNIIKKCAAMEKTDIVPVALIIDSPWIPGYTGMSTLDFFTIPDKWFEAHMKIKKDFPGMIFLPDFWIEYGMATEPSGFGCRINFFENSTPNINHIISSADDLDQVESISQPNPKRDGLMPLALNLYKNMETRAKEVGESIKIVAARGPLTIATHMMGLTEFLIALKTDPDNTHKLLKITSTLSRDWLQAQAEVLSEVEGIMILDDVVGFLSKEDYMEFAHPYMKDILKSFPGCIKIFHNDTNNAVCYEFLEELGINIFNFTHKQDISKVRKLLGNKICLLGNIPPLDVLAQGNPEQVREATARCLRSHGAKCGIILSAGGGTSPGTSRENLLAMMDTAEKVSRAI
jgi:MtaA/CmuA family methyltransferase